MTAGCARVALKSGAFIEESEERYCERRCLSFVNFICERLVNFMCCVPQLPPLTSVKVAECLQPIHTRATF